MRHEGTGWRDEALSARHRLWGDTTVATDIDMLVVEYDFRIPIALIDYKRGLGYQQHHYERFNLAILATLASGYAGPKVQQGPVSDKGLPFFVVSYRPDPWQFKVQPYNEAAKEILPETTWNLVLSEERFVRFLYWLRGRTAPVDVLNNLRSVA